MGQTGKRYIMYMPNKYSFYEDLYTRIIYNKVRQIDFFCKKITNIL